MRTLNETTFQNMTATLKKNHLLYTQPIQDSITARAILQIARNRPYSFHHAKVKKDIFQKCYEIRVYLSPAQTTELSNLFIAESDLKVKAEEASQFLQTHYEEQKKKSNSTGTILLRLSRPSFVQSATPIHDEKEPEPVLQTTSPAPIHNNVVDDWEVAAEEILSGNFQLR